MLPKNRRRTEVPFPFSGSTGAVGRHNNTQNRAAFGEIAGGTGILHVDRAAFGEIAGGTGILHVDVLSACVLNL